MTARTSFLLCIGVSMIPLGPITLGLYQFFSLESAAVRTSPIADLCMIAYERSLDLASHASVAVVTILLFFLLVRTGVVVWKGVAEIRQIGRLPLIVALDEKASRVVLAGQAAQPQTRVLLVDAAEPFAVTVGYLSPRVLLSAGLVKMLNDQELDAVLHHELTHARRRDPLLVLLSDCCRAALPFVPLVGYIAEQFRIGKEIEADAEAIKAVGSSLPLASALSTLLAALPAQAPRGVGLSPTEARIDVLLGRRHAVGMPRSLIVATLLSVPSLVAISLVLYAFTLSPHLTPLHICPS